MEKRQYTTGLPSMSVYPQGMMGGAPQAGYPGMTGGYPGYPHTGYPYYHHHHHYHPGHHPGYQPGYHPGYQPMQMSHPQMPTGTYPQMGGYPQTTTYRSK